MYIKNWIVVKRCSIIYCGERKKELVILHSDACWHHVSCCQDLPTYHVKAQVLHDAEEILHFQCSQIIHDGVVDWPKLSDELRLKD